MYLNKFNNIKIKVLKKVSDQMVLLTIRISLTSGIKILSILSFIIYLAKSSNNNFLIYIYKIFFNKNKPYFIFLEKAGFNEDTFLIKKTFKDYECIGFSRGFIKGIARFFLSREIDDNSYFSCSPIEHKSKIKLFHFYDFLFSKLPIRFKPVAIFTGNFGYYPEQELFKAAAKNNIKGIAIHKECIKPNGIYDLWRYVYSVRRTVYGGTLILNYNKSESELQKITQVIDTKKTKMEIIGCPRLDKAHLLRKNSSFIKNHKVLIFGFGTKSFLPKIPRKNPGSLEPHNEYLDRNHQKLSWKNLLEDLCKSIYTCASQNPRVPFLIKLKDVYRENNEIINYFKHKKKLENIKIITIGNALELLENSSIVISHRSTTLFEGIARGIPVIIPNLGECQNKKYKPYIFKFSDADKDLITVNTKKDLIETINNLLKMKPKVETKLSKTKKEILDKWMGNSDGKSSKRLIAVLKKEFK